jgi:ketosteroid isomerase-like protein
MHESNIEVVRRGYEHFLETGKVSSHLMAPGFVWDMSAFRGWPDQSHYEGAEGAERFMAEWLSAWQDWSLVAESFHDAGDEVVAVMNQRGRARSSGLEVSQRFAQVWTVRDGVITRMQMYADPAEAFEAVGLGADADVR